MSAATIEYIFRFLHPPQQIHHKYILLLLEKASRDLTYSGVVRLLSFPSQRIKTKVFQAASDLPVTLNPLKTWC